MTFYQPVSERRVDPIRSERSKAKRNPSLWLSWTEVAIRKRRLPSAITETPRVKDAVQKFPGDPSPSLPPSPLRAGGRTCRPRRRRPVTRRRPCSSARASTGSTRSSSARSGDAPPRYYMLLSLSLLDECSDGQIPPRIHGVLPVRVRLL
jgi:hypothetical protein